MFKSKVLIVALGLCAGTACARDFSPQPAMNSTTTTMNFDIGEAAVASTIRLAGKTPSNFSDPLVTATVTMKEADMEFTPDQGRFTLHLHVKYTYLAGPDTEDEMQCERVFPTSAVEYDQVAGELRVDVDQTLACTENLPPYLKAKFDARQPPFEKIPKILVVSVGQRTDPVIRSQMDKALPMFYMGGGTPQVQIVDDFLRILSLPQWEIEKNTIQAYAELIGPPGPTQRTRINLITNFEAEITALTLKKGNGTVMFNLSPPLAAGDIYGLRKEPTDPDPRYSRYNYYTPANVGVGQSISGTLTISGRKFYFSGTFGNPSFGYINLSVTQ